MTPDQSNAIIAKALWADPDWKWQPWAMVRLSPDRYHFVPRDFAAPENTLRLLEWAARQDWYGGETSWEVWEALRPLVDGLPKAEAVAREVRDIIAKRLEEIEDGN